MVLSEKAGAVQAEGGTLALANRREGGLRVTIRLPHALT